MHDFAKSRAVVNSVVEFSGDPLDGGGFMTGAEVAVSLDKRGRPSLRILESCEGLRRS
jgi:hypothetical protein